MRNRFWLGAIGSILGCAWLMMAAPTAGWAAVKQISLRRAQDFGANRGWGHIDVRVRVSGNARVAVRGGTLWIEAPNGQSITDNGSQASEALPSRPAPIEAKKSFGRGNVKFSQKPSAQNQYTAILEISDPQQGIGVYDIQLRFGDIDGNPQLPSYRWDTVWSGTPWRQPKDWTALPGSPLAANRRRESTLDSPTQGGFRFDGTVDNDVVFFIRGNQVRAAGDARRMPQPTTWSIIKSLPNGRRPRSVRLNTQSGNAVRIIEYPSFRNYYTMVVRVAPPSGKSIRASFSVIWN